MCSIIVPLVLWHLMFSKAVPGPPKPKAAVPAPNLAKMRRPIPTQLHTPHPTLPPTQKASEAQTEQRPLEFRQSFANLGPNIVGGWLDYEDAYGARLVSDEQLRQGIAGSVGEIGVHHGLFFLALALSGTNDRSSSAAHPHLFAADVFSHQELNFDRSGKGDREIFLNNCKRFAGLGEQDILLLEGSSLDGLLTKLRSSGMSPSRLISVDACHTRECTLNDVNVASSFLVEGGVVIVDDFVNPGWPGVAQGVHEHLRSAETPLVPFLLTCNKLYLTTRSHASVYMSAVRGSDLAECIDPAANSRLPDFLSGVGLLVLATDRRSCTHVNDGESSRLRSCITRQQLSSIFLK